MAPRPTIALAIAVMAGALCASPAFAQFRGGGGRGGGGRGFAPSRGPVFTIRGGSGRAGVIPRGRRGFFPGLVFLPPYWYPDEGYQEQAVPPEEPPVQVVLLNPPQPPAPIPPSPPPESLLLVYQGGQWVRVPTGSQIAAGPLPSQPGAAAESESHPGAAGAGEAGQAPAVSPNVVLVFRDGHREEVNKYVIEGDTIYASADYWSTGSWTKQIPMSQLDVPATVRANQERGVKFDLPSGPDEVVVGF